MQQTELQIFILIGYLLEPKNNWNYNKYYMLYHV